MPHNHSVMQIDCTPENSLLPFSSIIHFFVIFCRFPPSSSLFFSYIFGLIVFEVCFCVYVRLAVRYFSLPSIMRMQWTIVFYSPTNRMRCIMFINSFPFFDGVVFSLIPFPCDYGKKSKLFHEIIIRRTPRKKGMVCSLCFQPLGQTKRKARTELYRKWRNERNKVCNANINKTKVARMVDTFKRKTRKRRDCRWRSTFHHCYSIKLLIFPHSE